MSLADGHPPSLSSRLGLAGVLAKGKTNVWNACWAGPLLRVQAPMAQWGSTVQKILVDQARDVAVIPVDKSKSWFWVRTHLGSALNLRR